MAEGTGGTQRHRRDTKTQEEIIRQEILKTSKAFLYHGATDIPSILFINVIRHLLSDQNIFAIMKNKDINNLSDFWKTSAQSPEEHGKFHQKDRILFMLITIYLYFSLRHK